MRILKLWLLSVCILHVLALSASSHQAYVALVHGILGDKHSMKPIAKYIKDYFGDTVYIKNVELGKGASTSWFNMEQQVEWFREALQEDPILAGKNIVIIAHSQGGLVARSFIEKYNTPHVHTYIALGSPQQGVAGSPTKIDNRFFIFDWIEGVTYQVMYTSFVQRYFSVAGYWKDTLHYDLYLKHCTFLPKLNNDIDHEQAELFKNNICSLENMVLVMATKETIVEPKESCHFGFYPVGKGQHAAAIEELFESENFQEDRLGLKTLHEQGRLHFGIASCTHTDIQEDALNFEQNILPFLKKAIVS